MSKMLIVNAGDDVYKYHYLYTNFLFEVNSLGHLTVLERDPNTGEEKLKASFREWSSYIVDEMVDF